MAKIDRITQMLLAQLEAQTQAALALLEQAPPEQRDAFLAQLAELRGRLVRLRRGGGRVDCARACEGAADGLGQE